MKKLILLMVVLAVSGCQYNVKTSKNGDSTFSNRSDAIELIDSLRETQNLKSVNIQSNTSKSGVTTIKVKVELYDTKSTESF